MTTSISILLRICLAAAVLLGCADAARAALQPTTPTVRVHDFVPLRQGAPRVCAGPDGSWTAVWDTEVSFQGQVVMARRFSPTGSPLTPELQVNEEEAGALSPDVACLPSGGFVVAWAAGVGVLDVRARIFDANGAPVTGDIDVASDPDVFEGDVSVAAAADGRFAVVWHVTDRDLDPGHPDKVALRRFDATGIPTAAAAFVHTTDPSFDPQPSIAMSPTGEAVVTWISDQRWELRGQRYSAAGDAAGPELLLHRDEQMAEIGSPEVAIRPDGRFLVVWFQNSSFGLFDFLAWARLFGVNGVALGAPFRLDAADYQQVATTVAETPGGYVAAWADTVAGRGILARVLDSGGGFVTPPVRLDTEFPGQLSLTNSIALAALGTAQLLVLWTAMVEEAAEFVTSQDVLARRFDAPLGAVGPPPPPGDWMASPTLPGFRFKTRFQGSIVGQQVVPCPPETVCASGALAGRAEALMRVIGPRPNGLLWPTLIRFTPARVEVWIEQLASGVVRYYVLPEVPRDSDELDGLVDRNGFLP